MWIAAKNDERDQAVELKDRHRSDDGCRFTNSFEISHSNFTDALNLVKKKAG